MKLNHIFAGTVIAAATLVAIPGCETVNTRIPGTASEVAAGTGDTVYQAGDSGTVYIYDKSWNKLVYTGPVLEGQMVKVDTFGDKVYIDNKVVVEQIPLGEGSRYQIFLDRQPVVTTIERRHVIAPETRVERRTIIEQPQTTVERRTIVEPGVTTERKTVIERETRE